MRRGGTFLGSGSFGCIFYPAIECSDNNIIPFGVGKIFANEEEADIEEKQAKALRNIDKDGVFINNLTSRCLVKKSKIRESNSKSECNHIDDDLEEYHQLVYANKGIDFSIFMKTYEYKFFDERIITFVQNMINGVELLQKHKLVHLDLKPENMLVTEDNKLLFIDFGLTKSFNDVYDYINNGFILKFNYFIYPPEFKIFMALSDIVNDKKINKRFDKFNIHTIEYITYFKKQLTKIYKKKYDGFKGYTSPFSILKFYGFSLKNYECQLNSLITNLVENNLLTHNSKNISQIFNKYADKIDVFSLGINILYILQNSKNIFRINPKQKIELFKLVFEATNMNPEQRIDIKNLKLKFASIVKNNKDNDYDEIFYTPKQLPNKYITTSLTKSPTKAPTKSPNTRKNNTIEKTIK